VPPTDALVRFLAGIGKPSELELYLDLFRAQQPERFAILAVDARVDQDALALDLRYLGQLGLHPHVAARGDDLLALARSRGTRKVIFLGPWRGLEPVGRPVPSLVDLTTELDELRPALPDEHRALLDEAHRLITGVEHSMTVSVTSPLDLLRELFTVRGAGTMIRRGAVVTRHADYASVDRERLEAVMESAFGATPPAALFERTASGIYVADDYAGAAVVSPSVLGAYLSKFAVGRRAQGAGIGRDLWRAIAADHPALFWRARDANAITAWYQQQCDGMARAGEWRVFWRGLAAEQIPRAIELACAAPVDFPV
jgi:hypothetical protein